MPQYRLPSNADAERGCRLKEISLKISGGLDNPTARAKFLGVENSIYRRYELGATISNELLAKIADLGGDVVYILTGKRSTPSPAPVGHTGDDPRAPLYRSGKNRFLNALHTMAEMEECARAAGGELEKDWDDVLEDFRASVEEMMPDAQREKKEAEEQALKSQVG